MTLAVHLLILFQFLVFAPAVTAAPRDIYLVTPEDKSAVEGELLPVVITTGQSAVEAVSITVNGKESARLAATPAKQFYCKTVKLGAGPNMITVSVFKKDGSVSTDSATVFYRSEISSEFSTIPGGFSRRPFHQDKNEVTCAPCHNMEQTEADLKPDTPRSSSCYQCHKPITDYRYVHGPVATWSCLSCHMRNSQPAKYATQRPEQDACYVCHVDEKKQWATKQFVHGPTATGKCSICHNPHASDNPYWLRKPPWDLCVACHGEMVHRTKSFAFISKPHPTKGPPDPKRPGKDLSCESCHEPHAANSDNLFKFGVESVFQLCDKCHPKR